MQSVSFPKKKKQHSRCSTKRTKKTWEKSLAFQQNFKIIFYVFTSNDVFSFSKSRNKGNKLVLNVIPFKFLTSSLIAWSSWLNWYPINLVISSFFTGECHVKATYASKQRSCSHKVLSCHDNWWLRRRTTDIRVNYFFKAGNLKASFSSNLWWFFAAIEGLKSQILVEKFTKSSFSESLNAWFAAC